MKLLTTLEDDFPSPPSTAVDSRRFYEAFLKAEDVVASSPKPLRAGAERQLNELTSHFYRSDGAAAPLFRRRDDASQLLTELWLSSVRQTAEWFIAANNLPVLNGFEKNHLSELPRRFCNPSTLPKVSPWLAKFGIALIYVSPLPGIKLDGAVYQASRGQVVVALSLRYSRLDYFWFTLLHELAHVVLHHEHLNVPILDDLEAESSDLIEKQADRLASDSLIPRNEWRSCPARFTNSADDIIAFAKKLGIPAESVAGRLRKELGRYDLFSEIVNSYNIRETLLGTQ